MARCCLKETGSACVIDGVGRRALMAASDPRHRGAEGEEGGRGVDGGSSDLPSTTAWGGGWGRSSVTFH